MRDVALLLVFLGGLPFALWRPVYGVLLWTWLSLMNPHRLTWGFTYDFSFAMVVAVVTLAGMVISKDPKRSPVTGPLIFVLSFLIWVSIGYPFSLYPEQSYDLWIRVVKIQFMTLVAASLIAEPKQVKWLLWVIVGSLGYYGVKGGLFTLVNGGSYIVWGPPGSFIEGNNELALALVMTIPLMWFLFEVTRNRWLRCGLIVAMLLCAMAALGSQSRGGLLAIAAMAGTFWWYGTRKWSTAIALIVAVPLMLAFMPDSWVQRIHTIATYDEDASAMGRINAWWNAWNLAKDHPLFGGGFEIYNAEVFSRYAPNPSDIHAAHSIYFQVLGEHGWIAFALFIAIWISAWRTAIWLRRNTSADGPDRWAFHLAAMSQVSLAGFAVGGAFLSLAYFDLPYYVVVALVAARAIVEEQRGKSQGHGRTDAAGNGPTRTGFAPLARTLTLR